MANIKKTKNNYNLPEKVTIDLKKLLAESSIHENTLTTNIKNELVPHKKQYDKINSLEEIKSIKEHLEFTKEEEQCESEETPLEEQFFNQDVKVSPIRVLGNTLFYVVLIFCIIAVYFFSDSDSSPRNFFGYSYFTVLTTSMQSVIPQGSLIVTKNVNPNQIEIGDDITYLVNHNTTFTHRVVDIYENYQDTGMRGFQTQGVNNPVPDEEIVIAPNIVGVVKFHVTGLGSALTYIKYNLWLIILIFVIFLALIIHFNIFLQAKKAECIRS